MTDLQALQVKDWDLDAYNTQFNKIMSKYCWKPGDEPTLKEAYARNLPNRVKEKMMVDRDFTGMTLN